MAYPVVYEPARKPSRGPTFGAKSLMAFTVEEYPSAYNLGIYNNRNVRGGRALSLHAEGRAGDTGFPFRIGGTPMGWQLANDLRTHHQALGVQQIIYARKVWRNTRANEGWRSYTGSHDHYEHVHWELTRAAAADLSPTEIEAVFNLSPSGDDEMAMYDKEALGLLRVEYAYYRVPGRDPDKGGFRFWSQRMIDAVDGSSGEDPDKVVYDLEVSLLGELSGAELEQISNMISDD